MRSKLIAGMLAMYCCGVSAQETTSSVYTIQDGRVAFPEWDSRKTTEPVSLAELGVGDFPGAVVYAERILLTEKPATSKPVSLPEDCTTITVIARARQVGNIFPHIRITLLDEAGPKHELFNGYWQSVSLEPYKWPIPAAAKGQKVKLRFEILNPGIVEEQRCWYFLKADVY